MCSISMLAMHVEDAGSSSMTSIPENSPIPEVIWLGAPLGAGVPYMV